jgi:endonuclease/exonuclease/phosphatase family metal-dependent hydrolase
VRLATWNTLHRIHAVNWDEAPIRSYPDERVRIQAIADDVATWLASRVDVVCLQEVSGDQLARIREAVDAQVDGARIFAHAYPRVPRLRVAGQTELDDPTEHLVVIVKCPSARLRTALTFDSDPGKGLLAVDVGDVATIVDVHVTFGERASAQLAGLAEIARASGRAAVLGDFNATADVVRAGLGAGFTVADVIGPTRTTTADNEGKTIDHVAVVSGAVRSVEVLDARGLSDHRPVIADVDYGR